MCGKGRWFLSLSTLHCKLVTIVYIIKRTIKMIERIKRAICDESGAVAIVEASFVFPIMFIILFFLIYMGNAFYVKAQVESVVEKYAIEGSNYCADPILSTIKEYGNVPSLSSLKTEPYRYIFGGMSDEESKISSAVEKETIGWFQC